MKLGSRVTSVQRKRFIAISKPWLRSLDGGFSSSRFERYVLLGGQASVGTQPTIICYGL